MSVTDEDLSAYADGMLDAEASARVAAAVAADPVLAERVARMRRQAATLNAAFAEVIAAPAPHRLEAVVLAERRPTAWSSPLRGRVAAIAAAMLLAFAAGWSMRSEVAGPVAVSDGALMARGALLRALDHQVAGEPGRGDVAITLSVQSETGFCRAFEVRSGLDAPAIGLACGHAGEWAVVALTEAPDQPTPEKGYAMARGAIPDSILQAADQRRAGDPLSLEAEREAIARGWKR
jgi:anti-sigma factor RsiW